MPNEYFKHSYNNEFTLAQFHSCIRHYFYLHGGSQDTVVLGVNTQILHGGKEIGVGLVMAGRGLLMRAIQAKEKRPFKLIFLVASGNKHIQK